MSRDPKTLYGFGEGDHVSLTMELTNEFDETQLRATLLSFNCYPPSIPKIFEQLRTHGRYDCVLQSDWFRGQYGIVKRELATHGVTLEVISMHINRSGKTPLKE
jgi:hypothetical protein